MAMHPAMTFTGTELDLDRLPGCVFGMTAGDAERAYAEGLVADLRGIALWVPEDKRTLYHAGLAHGANHLVTLVSQAMELLRPRPAQRTPPRRCARCSPLHSTTRSASGDAALTGPIVRGDVRTVQAHLDDIAEQRPDHHPVVRRDGEGDRRPGRAQRSPAPDPGEQAGAHARRGTGARR